MVLPLQTLPPKRLTLRIVLSPLPLPQLLDSPERDLTSHQVGQPHQSPFLTVPSHCPVSGMDTDLELLQLPVLWEWEAQL